MFILGIIGYTLLRLFGADLGDWLYWFNSASFQFNWIGMIAVDLKSGGWFTSVAWMAPFVWVAAVGTAKTGFSGTGVDS